MGYEACGEAVDDLLASLDDDELHNSGKISQKTKDLRQLLRGKLKSPR